MRKTSLLLACGVFAMSACAIQEMKDDEKTLKAQCLAGNNNACGLYQTAVANRMAVSNTLINQGNMLSGY